MQAPGPGNLPCGELEWDFVLSRFNEILTSHGREHRHRWLPDQLSRRFNTLANKAKPTGSGRCLAGFCERLTLRAYQIRLAIKQKAVLGTSDDPEDDLGFGDEEEQEEQQQRPLEDGCSPEQQPEEKENKNP